MSEVQIDVSLVESFNEETGELVLTLDQRQRDLLIEYAINDILRRYIEEHDQKVAAQADDYEHNDYYYDINRNR